MNYGKLTAGTTKTAIDTAKPSEKGEIITYLSRMGDVLEQVFEGHQVVALGVFRVHIVVDGDVADAELREPLLDVQPCVQLVSPQTAEILGDDDPDFPVLHVRHHALEIRPVETGPGVSVIHIKLDVGKAMVPGVLL